tara:strand:+ start:2902 stop:3318 length:417 start_codon:yes stop_codon:yes gene_type:complete
MRGLAGEAEGEDTDEYFASLYAAKRRRRELVSEMTKVKAEIDGGLAIERMKIAKMPRKVATLALLNRRRYVDHVEAVVPEYVSCGANPCPGGVHPQRDKDCGCSSEGTGYAEDVCLFQMGHKGSHRFIQTYDEGDWLE